MRHAASLKVLMISSRSDMGGGPAHMYALSQGLDARAVFVALPNDGDFYHKFLARLGAGNVCVIPRQKFTWGGLISLKRFCRNHSITLIHSHGKGAGVYARLLGILLGLPVVHTLHGYHDVRYGFVAKKIYALWETLAGLLTRKVICVSESERRLFSQKVFVREGALVTIHNGTHTPNDHWKEIVPRKIVTVARFDYAKNLLEFVRVAQQLRSHIFHIIGDGEERDKLEEFIASHGITNVVLRGISYTVMSDIADAEVYLSTSRWEGMPMAVLEAMSLGIPVVASDVVGNQDAVSQNVTGYLYPLGDISGCIQAIGQAKLLDRSRIRQFHSENYSSERMIATTLALYQSVVQGRAV